MSRNPMTITEHLDAMEEVLLDVADARKDGDWPRVQAGVAEAQLHIAAAELLRRIDTRDLPAGRDGDRWRKAAGR